MRSVAWWRVFVKYIITSDGLETVSFSLPALVVDFAIDLQVVLSKLGNCPLWFAL